MGGWLTTMLYQRVLWMRGGKLGLVLALEIEVVDGKDCYGRPPRLCRAD